MNVKHFLVGGTKSAPSYHLNAITQDEQIRAIFGQQHSDQIGVVDAYKAVPWLYRAIDVRSKAVQGMPFRLMRNKADVTENPKYASLLKSFKRNLGLIESSLCLHGCAYLIRETNPTDTKAALRWLLPETIHPKYSASHGLVGFKREIDNQKVELPPDRVVYFWQPNIEAELGPGVAPAEVALRSAGVLHHLGTYLQGYFERGAIRATLLTIEGSPSQPEMQKLEAWWKKMLTGVKKAYETVALRASVKPVVIGDGLKETFSDKLTAGQRQEIATALGIPHTLLESDAANYATAQEEALGFYTRTILPECELIAEAFNDQLFGPMGLKLEFDPDKLEVFQTAQLQTAQAVSSLVGKPILTLNEGRELLGYDPIEEPETPEASPVSSTSQEPPQAAQTPEDAAKVLDITRWSRKSQKAFKNGKSAAVAFESDHIPQALHEAISEALSFAENEIEIKAVFAVALGEAEE